MNNNDTDKPPNQNQNGELKSELLVYVYNVVEDEWSFINYLANPKKKFVEIRDCEATADCFFLSMATEPEFVFISPQPLSKEFQEYAKNLLNFKSADVIVPESKSHLICEDLVADTKAFNQLIETAKHYRRITLISYAVSTEFYKLKDTLIQLGLNVYTPEAPEIDCAWTVNFFGSKSGIRQLAQKSSAVEPDFIMPEGVICVGRSDAALIAANKYLKQKGVVIKTNKGSGGSGVLIFRENELPNNYLECEKAIIKSFNNDKYWDNLPIVVEDLVNINYGLNGGFPSVEYKIQKNGRIDMLYYCAMNVSKKGKFYGLDINNDSFNDRITAQITDTGFFIAEQYSAAGYRGHFDVDMMAAKNNKIYVSESNTRNSGGTDVFRISQKLLGKDFMYEAYIISRSHLMLPKTVDRSFTTILSRLSPLLYRSDKREGVIINSENALQTREMIYMVIAKNKKQAYEIDLQMKQTLGVSESQDIPENY